jgi:hypothetical protein
LLDSASSEISKLVIEKEERDKDNEKNEWVATK